MHRNVNSTPEAFLEIVGPYRDDLVVAAECMFTWYWLADVCAAEGIAFVLGHAGSESPMMGRPLSSPPRTRVPGMGRPSPEPGDNGRAHATSLVMRRPV